MSKAVLGAHPAPVLRGHRPVMNPSLKPLAQPNGPWPVESAANTGGDESWFCVRTHPKHEHIAAAHLRREQGVEVFIPRVRYRRSTRCGPAWVTEALFSDYLFARFDLATALRRVHHARAVCGVVRFGDQIPSVPDAVIESLRHLMGGQDLRTIEDALQPGDRVCITGGAMHGLEAVVLRVMPAKQRVAILLDFLGRQTPIEMNRSQLSFDADAGGWKTRAPVWQAAESALARIE